MITGIGTDTYGRGVVMPLNPATTLPPSPVVFRFNPATTLPPSPVVFRFDPELGTATLTGTVTNFPAQPVARRVILIEERSGRVIRETWSDATTGVYSFPNIMGGRKYTVVSYDHTGFYRAVIADNLEPT